MNKRQLIERLLSIRMWGNNGVRAPHKPLLLLLVLAKLNNHENKFYYQDIEEKLKSLLQDFGPPRRSYHPQYPFWRLQNDDVWNVITENPIQNNSSGDVARNALITNRAYGQFDEDLERKLLGDRDLIRNVILQLLEQNFPDTIHEDILQAIGFDLEDEQQPGKKKRSSAFREKVLRAYEYRCAVCGFDVRLGHTPIGLEAAHIKWHQAGGPDEEVNGIALCALHHKLFDRGAFTISNQFEILVSDRAHGTQSFSDWLMRYHGKRISSPQSKRYNPKYYFLGWHAEEVFQEKYRDF